MARTVASASAGVLAARASREARFACFWDTENQSLGDVHSFAGELRARTSGAVDPAKIQR